MSRYSLGLDFGTLSVRGILICIESGEAVATAVSPYAHGVMSSALPDGTPLPPDYALQHPQDYLDGLVHVITECLAKAQISPEEIIGVGIDFTASTVLPVLADGTPLCFLEEFSSTPHAYVKLWKHHAAQKEADEINALAKEVAAPWLARYGGSISGEWLFPKVLQVLREAPTVYDRTFRFVEAGDWIVWMLTGEESHSVCTTGFKAMWNEEEGYPGKDFLRALHPALEHITETKISKRVTRLSEIAGYVTQSMAQKTGLAAGTPVSPAFIDAHAALPALGITKAGELLMIIGTSTCHILLSDTAPYVPGISGYVKDGIIDGLYAFEAGQASVGDTFEWFIENCVPADYTEKAKAQGLGIHAYLRSKAALLPPGANGLMALDWFNGNRTPYDNGRLRGLICGLTLSTSPAEIYRALIEATAYGAKRILELYEQNGIRITRIYAAGGIAEKDELLMQIYADVLGREVYLSGTSQACAFGSALLGAVREDGYATLAEAAERLRQVSPRTYVPDPARTQAYASLYEEYVALSELFARRGKEV